MVQSYLRYEEDGLYGIISSPNANVIYDKTGKYAIAPALQDIIIWNIRQGTKEKIIHTDIIDGNVTCIVLSPNGDFIAVGYSNGSIRIFDLLNYSLIVTLDGHKTSISCLTYNIDGSILASGSNDTDIIIWDVIAQSGRFRLIGHKDVITQLKIMDNYLISSSKDTLMKLWDLETQFCIQTCVGHRNEIWDFDINIETNRIITGTSDNQLRTWELNNKKNKINNPQNQIKENINNNTNITYIGSLIRTNNARIVKVKYNFNKTLVACQISGKNVEIYKIRTPEEIKKKMKRRLKRQKEKEKDKLKKKKLNTIKDNTNNIENDENNNPSISENYENNKENNNNNLDNLDNYVINDEMELLCILQTSHKIACIDFIPFQSKNNPNVIDTLLIGLQNNSIEFYDIIKSKKVQSNSEQIESQINDNETYLIEAKKSNNIVLQGHRSDIRSISISSDDELILTLSTTLIKIWNIKTMQCIKTFTTNMALCGLFVPGNRHIIIGTKEGMLQLFDIGSGECLYENKEAHTGALWSMDLRPDYHGIMTGSADHDVKFWDFDLVNKNIDTTTNTTNIESTVLPTNRQLNLVHTRTLKMAEDVLVVKYSNTKNPEKLLIAVALLDCTVKVFYEDSLKFFLSLYGHKLPVMSIDISSDESTLITASADKNVKLWGLDFGDCHKSIFAHDDSIMSVKFIRKTHYFFTASKDKSIKYWDGDTFERILTLNGHQGQIWDMVTSTDGNLLISVSSDRSIRKWKRTKDLLFLQEEREKEMEEMFEAELNHSNEYKNINQIDKSNNNDNENDNDNNKTVTACRRTIETVKSGEKLMEAIDLADSELNRLSEYENKIKNNNLNNDKSHIIQFKPNIILLGYTPIKYVLKTIRSIRPQDIEESLFVLPFDYVKKVIKYLLLLIEEELDIELCCNCLLILIKQHYNSIVAHKSLYLEINEIWTYLREQIKKEKNQIGFNISGLKYIKSNLQNTNIIIMDDQPIHKRQKLITR